MLRQSRSCCWPFVLSALLAASSMAAEPEGTVVPRASDARLEVIRFAAAPEIVQPINLDFDRRGRLLVIESHTHFRPAQYVGPQHDRIRMLEDTNGDGRADRFTTVFEATTFTMDLAVHPDGSIYVATRSEIIRLRPGADGVARESQPIVRLETAGNYPHNGLSGLAFDARGNLWFGLGENLGASYKLIGADGTSLADEGEGGNVFTCSADGKQLRRVATGFWNPFGMTFDAFGRLWAVDNDPDSMPPCRLLHVVDGGDYGYQFRYGRTGRHPFQAWNGQLLGTLPMVSGTGEAPCEVISYESDGLPREYLGNLFVPSWADHRVERYVVRPRGASYVAERQPFIQGDSDFRPVGLAVAPDGSLFASDWVRRDYALHGQGAIWHIRQRDVATPARPTEPKQMLASGHRPLRTAAARKLAADKSGLEILRHALTSDDVHVRATALEVLADRREVHDDMLKIADGDADVPLRAHAIELLVAQGEARAAWLDAAQPAAVRMAAVAALRNMNDVPQLLKLLDDDDPFLRSAAVRQLGHSTELLDEARGAALATARARGGLLLAERAAGRESVENVGRWLHDADEEVRFLAVKWIADRRLTELRPQVAKALDRTDLNVRMYQAYATALSRIDGQEVSDAKMADYFVDLLTGERAAVSRRVAALRLTPASHKRLSIDLLRDLLADPDAAVRLEAVRALAEHPDPIRFEVLQEVVRGAANGDEIRAEALAGLAARVPPATELCLNLALEASPVLRDEALRAMIGDPLSPDQRGKLTDLAERQPQVAALVARLLAQPHATERPPATDTAAWLKRLDGPADSAAGRRVFHHAKLAGCFRCHRVDGRGQEVGPDLSMIGRTERRHVLESILQPSNLVPPHFQVWQLVMDDGRTLSGMLLRTDLDEYTYVDSAGKPFKVRTVNIEESRPASNSIMPTGMVDRLTDQELRDLLAYLGTRR